MPPLLVAGLISGGIAAISNFFGARERNDKLKQQAENIRNSFEKLQEKAEQSPEEIEEAVRRMAAIYDAAEPQIKKAIEIGANEAILQLKDQFNWSIEDLDVQLDKFRDIMQSESKDFRETWQESFDSVQDALVKRRLGASEARAEIAKKAQKRLLKGQKEIAEKIGKTEEEFARQRTRLNQQLSSNIRNIKAQASSQLARQLGSLTLARGQAMESVRQRAEASNLQLAQQGLLAESRAGALEAGEVDPSLAALQGFAAGGARDIIGGLLFGKATPETINTSFGNFKVPEKSGIQRATTVDEALQFNVDNR